MNRIKVLKFLNHFGIGGTERQFVYTANGLDSSRFDVEIACSLRDGPLLQKLRPEMPCAGSRLGQFLPVSKHPQPASLAKDIRGRRSTSSMHTAGTRMFSPSQTHG